MTHPIPTPPATIREVRDLFANYAGTREFFSRANMAYFDSRVQWSERVMYAPMPEVAEGEVFRGYFTIEDTAREDPEVRHCVLVFSVLANGTASVDYVRYCPNREAALEQKRVLSGKARRRHPRPFSF